MLKATWKVGDVGHTQGHNDLAVLINGALPIPSGLHGDGQTDDSPAIQAALQLGSVYLPAANYRLNAPLWVSSGTFAAAPGAMLFYHGAGPAIVVGGIAGSYEDICLTGFALRGDFALSGASGIEIYRGNYCTLDRLRITGFTTGAAVYLFHSAIGLTLKHCHLDGNAYGLLAETDAPEAYFNTITLENTTFHLNTIASVYMVPDGDYHRYCADWLFRRVLVEQNAGGMLLHELRGPLAIENCWFEENGGPIVIDGQGEGLPHSAVIRGCLFSQTTPYIEVVSAALAVVTENFFCRSETGTGKATLIHAGATAVIENNYAEPPLIYP